MLINFLPKFLLALFSVFSGFKTPWHESLLAQRPNTTSAFKFTSLASNSTNILFQIGHLVHSHYTTSALNNCHLYCTFTLHRVGFALPPQSTCPTLYPHCSCLSWMSACCSPNLWKSFHDILDISTLTLPSNLISKTDIFFLVQAFRTSPTVFLDLKMVIFPESSLISHSNREILVTSGL